MFRQQYKIVVLKYCCSFIQNFSKHFCNLLPFNIHLFLPYTFWYLFQPRHQFYILRSCLYFCLCLLTIHISFASLQYSALQYSFGTIFFVHIFYLAFFVSNHFEFLFQSFQLNVVDKCIKPTLTCKFHFIFYFYSSLKSCNFNYINLLLLIKNSFSIRHCNYQPCSHINLLKLTNYVKAKCLYEVIFFLYNIGYLNHSVHSPHFCWGIQPSTKFSKRGALQNLNFQGEFLGKWEVAFSQRFQFLHKK